MQNYISIVQQKSHDNYEKDHLFIELSDVRELLERHLLEITEFELRIPHGRAIFRAVEKGLEASHKIGAGRFTAGVMTELIGKCKSREQDGLIIVVLQLEDHW